MATIIGKFQASDQLRMAKHGGHTVARMKIVNGDRFVSARSGQEDARAVQHHLDQGAVLAHRAFEGLDVLAVAHHVDADISVLASRQNMFVVVL